MTPVFLLSDGYLANGSEPWCIPDVASLPHSETTFATEPNDVDANGDLVFHPFLRDPETLARPWAIPGTPGLEYRIGGIEKADVTGDISYDPDNHDRMTRLRQAKIDGIAKSIPDVEVDDPSGVAEVLILGWGSTYGPIAEAARLARLSGVNVARAHIRHISPFHHNLGEVLRKYERVIVPEMNLGQLAMMLRAKYLVDVQSYTQVRGLPFTSVELAGVLTEAKANLSGATRLPTLTSVCRVPEPSACRTSWKMHPSSPRRTSPATWSPAGARAVATTRSSQRSRGSCPSSVSSARTSC